MSVISKGRHDIVIKQEGKIQGGFFKATKKQYPMFPFQEDKIKTDDYGEIIKPEDYKLADTITETEDNKENVIIKKEEPDPLPELPEIPTKCIVLNRTVQVNCQVQYIDFEGRSDGESLLKILSQLRPRRLVIVRGDEESTSAIANYCKEHVDSKIFIPNRGEIIDVTSETHIYQVRLTDALISQLSFQKGKDSELAWVDAQIVLRESQPDAKPIITDAENDVVVEPMEVDNSTSKIFTLEPSNQCVPHDTVYVNELKLSEFKQILSRSNISSEFSAGVLWCCNGTIAIRKVTFYIF